MNSRGGATLDRLTGLGVLDKEFFFAAGLLGFPDFQRYKIEPFDPGDGSGSPFLLLNAVGEALTFPVIHPAFMGLDYRLPAGPELLSALAARSPEDLVPLLIVTVRDRVEEFTVNLQGPLILNPVSATGVQLVLEDRPLRQLLLRPPLGQDIMHPR